MTPSVSFCLVDCLYLLWSFGSEEFFQMLVMCLNARMGDRQSRLRVCCCGSVGQTGMVPSPSLAWSCACECATEVWNSGRKWSQVPGGPLRALSMWVKHQWEDMVNRGHE